MTAEEVKQLWQDLKNKKIKVRDVIPMREYDEKMDDLLEGIESGTIHYEEIVSSGKKGPVSLDDTTVEWQVEEEKVGVESMMEEEVDPVIIGGWDSVIFGGSDALTQ